MLQQRRWVGVSGPVTNRSSDTVRWGASVLFFPHQGSRERVEVSEGGVHGPARRGTCVP